MGAVCAAWRFWHAVCKNGGWDDPVEARTGAMYEDFQNKVQARGLGAQAAPYLCWRYSYLWCASFFSVFSIVVQIAFGMVKTESLPTDLRDSMEETFGISLDDEYFEEFALHWQYRGWYLLGIFVLSTLVLFAAVWYARPALAVKNIRNRHISARLVLCSWLIFFLAPFVILLMFSMRGLINWRGLEINLCNNFTMSVYRLQPINITSTIEVVRQTESKYQGFSLFPGASSKTVPTCTGYNKPCMDSLHDWCAVRSLDRSASWSHTVNVDLAACALKLEETCRKELCNDVPGIGPRPDCFQGCVAMYAAANVTRTMQWLRGQKCERLETYLREGIKESFDPENFVMSLSQAASNQRAAVYALWQTSKNAGMSLELTIGMFVGGWAARLLLPAAFSFLAGLVEALVNVKICFPGQQHPVYVVSLAVLLPLPVYLCLLAFCQQVVGDLYFALACLLLCAYLTASFLTAARSMEMRSGDAERWSLYKKIWGEYGYRCLTFVSSVVVFFFFFKFSPGFRLIFDEFLDVFDTGYVLMMGSTFVAQKGRIATAFTDIFMTAHMRAEIWRQLSPQESTDIEQQTLLELGGLLLPAWYEELFDEKEIQMTFASGRFARPSRKTFETARSLAASQWLERSKTSKTAGSKKPRESLVSRLAVPMANTVFENTRRTMHNECASGGPSMTREYDEEQQQVEPTGLEPSPPVWDL